MHPDAIRAQATKILPKYLAQSEQDNNHQTQSQNQKKSKKSKTKNENSTLFDILFKAYDKAKNPLNRCALAYLLKNNCQVSQQEEDPNHYALRRSKKEKEIERLKKQLQSRIPCGRDLTGKEWQQTLITATSSIPESDDEANIWQKLLLKKDISLPFPIRFRTNEDLILSKNEKGRICVKFSGEGLNDHIFEIYCDNRQIHWFQRFLEDQSIKHNNKDQHSSALFTLRSATLAWHENKENPGNGLPWNTHRLTLYCTVDIRLWTNEGTQQVKQEKVDEITQQLANMEQKGNLNQNQPNYVKRLQSTLSKLNNPYPRHNHDLYQGKPSILVGVSLGLEKPATLAIVDSSTNEVLAYRSVKQLLGDNYKLLNRQRQQQQRHSHERHKAQKSNTPNKLSESELGKYRNSLSLLVPKSQQSDLNRRPSDYKSDALPLCYAGGYGCYF